jgi:hypothetical protein
VIVKHGLATLACVVAVFACGVSASSASTASSVSTAAIRASAGSCTGGTVPAIVDATFMCLTIGGPCTAQFRQDYAKFQLSCTAGRLVRATAHSAAGPAVADAFLNTQKNDLSTRMNAFKLAGVPPVLHLTFKHALAGRHKLSVDVHNTRIDAGQTFNSVLQSGWQFTYVVLPTPISNSTAGTYRVTVSIDGAGKKQLIYTIRS